MVLLRGSLLKASLVLFLCLATTVMGTMNERKPLRMAQRPLHAPRKLRDIPRQQQSSGWLPSGSSVAVACALTFFLYQNMNHLDPGADDIASLKKKNKMAGIYPGNVH